MNNFKVTNLKSPENDNEAVHKKYLREQINPIEIIKNFVNETKLQQEVAGLISFIQKQLVNVVNKTELQNLISLTSKLDDKIAKQKLDIQQLIDNIPDENEDTFQQELNALETKLNSELQKELRNIKQQIQNIDDSEIKTYIQQQIQNIDDSEIKTYIQQQIQNIDDSVTQQQITTINNLVLKQDKNIVALEKYLKKENKSYYFSLPFGSLSNKDASITDNIDRSRDYEYRKYGFTANIRVYKHSGDNPYEMFVSDYSSVIIFRGKLIIEITFPFQKKWKRQKQIMGNSNYLQNINFICSYQHEKSSLAAWGNSSNLPMNLRKITDINITKYTEDNWESVRHEWEPYAKRDTLCLGACLII
ncbi:hypothetical protein LOTGIDRAFT_161994 [Lottia gigantea]|uniref:Uncharacterized protein n=1 Tax=Lottia gigantea TaxID=225164 RepID=V4AHU4_LOTGI|nr:hypothetical protein LOTGIDRAFT_161994 [Lottia gigantea]ESO92966.1 hypothetical protein LOTGIDRAFT_161994 [Lottia gigantea]